MIVKFNNRHMAWRPTVLSSLQRTVARYNPKDHTTTNVRINDSKALISSETTWPAKILLNTYPVPNPLDPYTY